MCKPGVGLPNVVSSRQYNVYGGLRGRSGWGGARLHGASVKEITIRLIAFRLADIVLTAIAYLVIMVVVSIVLRVVVAATGLIRRLPVIKQADKLGGLIVGLVEGIAVVWIFFTVVTAISGTQAASNILVQIHGNAILESLYNCNPITSLLFSTIR